METTDTQETQAKIKHKYYVVTRVDEFETKKDLENFLNSDEAELEGTMILKGRTLETRKKTAVLV